MMPGIGPFAPHTRGCSLPFNRQRSRCRVSPAHAGMPRWRTSGRTCRRRPPEECFQSAKNEAGLDHYQVRRYDAWYRHATLAVLAHAYLAVTAATAPKALAAASSRSRSRRSAVSWHT